MLAGAERIARDMAAFSSDVRGKVRLLVTASVMAESLADDVAAFLQVPAHRDSQVDLEERISAEVVRGVAQGSASLGICWDSPHGTDLGTLQSRPYRSDHLTLVVHASHPLAGAASVRLEDTLPYDHVSLPVSSAVQVMLRRAAADLGKALVHPASSSPALTQPGAWSMPTWRSASCRAKWPRRLRPAWACD